MEKADADFIIGVGIDNTVHGLILPALISIGLLYLVVHLSD